MISRTWSRKSIAFCIAVAVLSVYSMVALATPGQKAASGELSVSGQVTVNGQAAISGATVFSDSVVATAANSSATISLGLDSGRCFGDRDDERRCRHCRRKPSRDIYGRCGMRQHDRCFSGRTRSTACR